MATHPKITHETVWSTEVAADGHRGLVTWTKVSSSAGFVDFRLQVEDPQRSSEALPGSVKEQLMVEAINQRTAWVRSELPRLTGDLQQLADVVYSLFERSLANEFVGQRFGGLLYVQDVAQILGMPVRDLWPVIEMLSGQHRLGLNGMLLWSWDEVNESRKREQQRTGHKALSSSDFGYWSCAACGKNGDDWTTPEDYPCTDENYETTGIMSM